MSNKHSDPSDWEASKLPRLSQLDSLQRCLICKDLLKAPVITSCNHTFCSQCIRQHLMAESLCPLCKTEQFESNLKRNILLEEIVLCFERLRPELLDQLKADEPAEPAPVRSTESASEPEVIEVSDEDSKPDKIPADHVQCPVCGQSMTAEFLQRSHIDDCLSGKKAKVPPAPRPAKRPKGISSFFQPRKRQDVNHSSFYFSQPEKHRHEIKKIPKVDFASLATPKIKEKLAQLKLPTTGTRAQLELRYNHYYVLHNSNSDSSHPVSDLALRQKLLQWEKSHSAFLAAAAPGGLFGGSLSHKTVSDKDFPVGLWLNTYKKEFRRLIRAARKTQKRKNGDDPSDNGPGSGGTADAEAANGQTGKEEKNGEKEENGQINDTKNTQEGDEDAPELSFDLSTSSLFVTPK